MSLTIIAAAYNSSGYLVRFFNSLAAQTCQDFMLVFVDDCSTDDTVERASELGRHLGPRMQVLCTEIHKGLVGARNTGLDYVAAHPSTFISFLDVDDWFYPNYMDDLLSTAHATSADLVVAGIQRIDDKTGHVLATEMVHAAQRVYEDSATCDELAFANPCSYAKLYRFDAIAHVRFRDIARSEDTCYLFEVLPHLKRVAFTNRACYSYCVHEDSLTGQFDTFVHESMHTVFEQLLVAFASGNQARYKDMFEVQVFVRSSVGGLLRRVRAGGQAGTVARQERAWLDQVMPSWRTNPYLAFRGKRSGGCKRWALKVCAALYKANAAPVFVLAYNLFVRVTGKEVRV